MKKLISILVVLFLALSFQLTSPIKAQANPMLFPSYFTNLSLVGCTTDVDNDGVCSEDDLDDNDPSVGVAPPQGYTTTTTNPSGTLGGYEVDGLYSQLINNVPSFYLLLSPAATSTTYFASTPLSPELLYQMIICGDYEETGSLEDWDLYRVYNLDTGLIEAVYYDPTGPTYDDALYSFVPGDVTCPAPPEKPPVPEPSTVVLMGLGLAGLAGLRYSRRKKH